jgi:SHS2 domain-containing protein
MLSAMETLQADAAGAPRVARWETFGHGSDVGVRGYGPTPAAAFEQAALALTSLVADLDGVEASSKVELACRADDLELLLVDFLNALIFEMATRRMLFGRFEVRLDGFDLRASAVGEPVDAARHQPAVEPKGATYTALSVRRSDDGCWLAQCVVDV